MIRCMVVLIPAYRPTERLPRLVEALFAHGITDIVVVDDGSEDSFAPHFEQVRSMGAQVLRHMANMGKGRSLKTGLNEIILRYPDRSVTLADCDGQYSAEDVLRVAELSTRHPEAVVLGVRSPDADTPVWGRIGNGIMKLGFFLSSGKAISDSQTGLRGLGADTVSPLLSVPGEHFDYMMNMLLHCPGLNIPILQQAIDTPYPSDIHSPHFHPLRDALRVFWRLFIFIVSSLASFAVDYTLYICFLELFHLPVQYAFLSARLLSALFNFYLNRRMVFQSRSNLALQVVSYGVLCIALALAGTYGVELLVLHLGLNQYLAKPLVDGVLFIISFLVQRLFIFRKP